MHPRKLAASLGLALACTPARPAPPAPPPAAPPVVAAPAPQPDPPPQRFACPALATSGSEFTLREAERLRQLFTAAIAGDSLGEHVVDTTAGARLLARIRERHACPAGYDDGLLSFADDEFGALDVDFYKQRVDLDELEARWLAHRAHAALRAHLAAHPDDLVSSTGPGDASLVFARHPDGATACVALADDHRADPRVVRCWRTDQPLRRAALLYHHDDDAPLVVWLRLGRALYSVEPDGALRSIKKAPRKHWRAIGAPGRGPDDPTTLTLREVPASSLPVAELRRIEPNELSDLPAIATEDALCVRIDAVWRCADIHERPEAFYLVGRPRPQAPVRTGDALTVPVEFTRCAHGSELSECQTELHLFRADARALHLAGSLPVGAEIDENLHDRDDTGLTVQGTNDDYRWRYRVEAPGCVRFLELDATHTIYGGRYPDGGRPKNVVRRKKPLPVAFEPAPADLPQRHEYDPYRRPDLRGLWQLRGDRWQRVDRCDP